MVATILMCQTLQANTNVNIGCEEKDERSAERMTESHQRISNQFNCGRPGCEVDIATLPRPQLRRSVAQSFKRAIGSFLCTQCGQVSRREFIY